MKTPSSSVTHTGVRHLSDRHFPEVLFISPTLTHMDSFKQPGFVNSPVEKGQRDLQLKLTT